MLKPAEKGVTKVLFYHKYYFYKIQKIQIKQTNFINTGSSF